MREFVVTIAPLVGAALVAVLNFWLSRDRLQKAGQITVEHSADIVLSPELSRAIDNVVLDVNEASRKPSTNTYKGDRRREMAEISVDMAMARHQVPKLLLETNPKMTEEQAKELLDQIKTTLEEIASDPDFLALKSSTAAQKSARERSDERASIE